MSKKRAAVKEGEEAPPFEGKKYKERILTVQAVQFDGENGEDVVSFAGGEDYGAVTGTTVTLTPGGKDPRSAKVVVERGQWVVKRITGTAVVNEGEFAGKFVNEDGSDIEALPPPPEPEPVAEDKLVYQPGFKPPEGEEKPAEEPAPTQTY
jgi:hypothetical protein